MNRQYLIYGGLVVGAIGLFFLVKNKNKGEGLLDNLGINTQGNTTEAPINSTPPLATPPLVSTPIGNLSTTSDGVSPSDANVNLANATVLAGERKILVGRATGTLKGEATTPSSRNKGKFELAELDKKLANLGYKVDAIGSLVKI